MRHLKRMVVWSAGILILALIAGLGRLSCVSNRVQSRIAAIAAAGDPVACDQLLPRYDESSDNAVTHLLPHLAAVEAINRDYRLLGGASDFGWRNGFSAPVFDALRKSMNEHAELARAHHAAAASSSATWPVPRSMSASELTESLLDICQKSRNVARYADVLAKLTFASGEVDAAANVYVDQLRLSRRQQDLPTLVHFATNLACRYQAIDGLNGILQTSRLTSPTQRAVEDELAEQESVAAAFVAALKTERALSMESVRELPLAGRLMISSMLDEFDQQLAQGASAQVQPSASPATGLAATLAPAIAASRNALIGYLARVRCLRILNAMAPHPAVDSREVAGSIETGQPGLVVLDTEALALPQLVAIDPFNGKPLSIRRAATGWIIYSVGDNLADDQGSTEDGRDVGLAPPQ